MKNSGDVDIKLINEKIEKESAFLEPLSNEINKIIVGQKEMVERLLIGLLTSKHLPSNYLKTSQNPTQNLPNMSQKPPKQSRKNTPSTSPKTAKVIHEE